MAFNKMNVCLLVSKFELIGEIRLPEDELLIAN